MIITLFVLVSFSKLGEYLFGAPVTQPKILIISNPENEEEKVKDKEGIVNISYLNSNDKFD